jgi:amphi-Trp domain-containing protein
MAKKDRTGSGDSEAPKRRSAQLAADLTTIDVATYLEALAGSLRQNRLNVQGEDEAMDVPVGSRAALRLKAKSSRRARRTSLDLRLDWRERPDKPIAVAEAGDGAQQIAAEADDKQTVTAEPESEAPQASEPATGDDRQISSSGSE